MKVACALLAGLAGCDRVFGLTGRGDAATAGGDTPVDDTILVEPALVGWYAMDALDDRTLSDTSGAQNHGSCVVDCPSIVPGRIGNALGFDGTTVIQVPVSASLNTTSGFTVMGWIQIIPQVSGPNGCPFSKVFGVIENSWQLCVDAGRAVQFFTYDTTSHVLEGDALSGGIWHHVALRWDGTTKQLFVNGLGRQHAAHATMFDTGVVAFGADFDDGDIVGGFHGWLDDVRIYASALEESEIRAIVDAAPQ